jgi:hypothetical protein
VMSPKLYSTPATGFADGRRSRTVILVQALRSLRRFTMVLPRNPVPPVTSTWPRFLVTSCGGADIVRVVYYVLEWYKV